VIEIESVKVRCLPDGRMDPPNSAAYLGLDEKTLANYRCRGVGPEFVRLGGRIFYFRAALDTWIAEGRAQSTAQARYQAGVNNGVAA
jgi:hypothetical protein